MGRLDRWLVALLAWAALSFGGVYAWGYWSISLWAAALAVWIIMATRAWQDQAVRLMAASLAIVAATMLLQIVPLPRSVFLAISPAADAILRELDVQYLIQPPPWHPLSVAPASTATALAVFVALSLLMVALTHAMARVDLDRLVVGITALGAALAVFAVMQRAADVRSDDVQQWKLVYGFWKPEQAGDVFGPFINRNHFAGWMLMAVPLALGYSCAVLESAGLSAHDGWRRWLRWTMRPAASRFMTLALAVLAMGAALTASGSRSGMASFAVAVAVLAAFVAMRLGRRRLRTVAVAYLMILLVGAIAWAGAGQAAHRFSLASTDAAGRLAAWRDTLRIVRDFPLSGTGIGGYGRAMLVYQTAGRDTFYAQAHNDYLQLAAEGGLLVGAPAAACLVALVGRIRARIAGRGDRADVYWIRAGAIAGLAGIASQSLMDFSLQLAGNAVLFVVLVSIALHRPSAHAARV
ncbi:MAG: O-antigen ligase family protein [Acidobacteria bacterium]|nr:O-antigen ligase family protein [Acidobacteriota bacterium]